MSQLEPGDMKDKPAQGENSLSAMLDIDFLIIGATKSATTWLQKSLQQHPGIYMPDPELHYFSREYHRGEAWYLSQFKPTEPHCLMGEKSNSYMDTPSACALIGEKLPHVKLIAQLRNPVERAYSDYCMLYRRGAVSRDIDQYLDPRISNGGRLLSGGLYYDQLQPYMDSFAKSSVLVTLYEAILTTPQEQLNKVASFLGLQSKLCVPAVTSRVKDRTQAVINPGLRRLLSPLKPIVRPLRQTSAFLGLRTLIAREPRYAPLTRDLRERLIDFYGPQVDRLGTLLGRDLSVWLSDISIAQGVGQADSNLTY